MSSIVVLIKREILIIIKNLTSYLFFIFIFPIILYLFLVTPFHNLLQPSSGMNYLYHGFPAILFLCTLIISFGFPLIISKRDRCDNSYFHFIISLPRDNGLLMPGFIFIIIKKHLGEFIQWSGNMDISNVDKKLAGDYITLIKR